MSVQILTGDCRDMLRTLPDESVHCVVTSPPYWGLRDYGTAQWDGGDPGCDHRSPTMRDDRNESRVTLAGSVATNSAQLLLAHRSACGKCGAVKVDNQLGLERSLGEHIQVMVEVFREVRRVLRKDGTLWLNYGSSYASGDTIANQSRQLSRVPACGNGDKEPLGSAVAGPACPDCGGELLACSLSHHDRIARKSQLSEQRRRRHKTKGHDNERSALEAGSHAACDVLPSTNLSSSANAQDVCGHEAKVSPARLKRLTSSDDVPPFVDNSVCTSGIALRDRPSFDRKSDKAFVCTACGYSTRMYPPHKPKDLVNVPFFVAEALRADGWYLRSDIIWSKCNPMPESVTDRPTKSHEYLFLLTKAERYYYDAEAIREPHTEASLARYEHGFSRDKVSDTGLVRADAYQTVHGNPNGRNKRTVWEIATAPFSDWGETVRRVRVEADAPHDGKKRITSPDCPLHGGRSGQATMVRGGGRAISPKSRNEHNDSHPAPGLFDGSAPIETPREHLIAQHSSDSPDLSCDPSATCHSTQNHKTGRVPATNPAYTASDKNPLHIAGKSTEQGLCGLAGHMHESNNVVGGMDDNQASRTPSHSVRKSNGSVSSSACTCEHYVEIIEKTSHFATFPPALIEPCIKAGTSEKGCCAKCGAPWVRKVESSEATGGNRFSYARSVSLRDERSNTGGRHDLPAPQNTTMAWSPSCSCEAPTVPCTVLDPFGGAGTTGLVADRLQRNAILIELNPEYAAMARRRIDGDAPLFAAPDQEFLWAG